MAEQLDNDREDGIVFVGLACSILSCVLSSIGLLVQKHSMNKNELELPLYKRWRWWLGFFLLVVAGGVLDATAMALAPLSLLAPMAGLTLLFNALFAPIMLKEKISKVEILATIVIFGGATMTSIYGDHKSETYDIPKLRNLFLSLAGLLYLLGVAIFVLPTILVLWFRAKGSVGAGGEKLRSQLAKSEKMSMKVEAILYGAVAAQIGALSNVFLKCTVSLIRTTADGNGNQFGYFDMYPIIAFTAVTAVGQLYAVNAGLARHKAVSVLTAYQSMLIVDGAIAGGVCFKEFEMFDTTRWILFPLGTVVTLLGLLILAQRKTSDESEEGERYNQFEDDNGVALQTMEGASSGSIRRSV